MMLNAVCIVVCSVLAGSLGDIVSLYRFCFVSDTIVVMPKLPVKCI